MTTTHYRYVSSDTYHGGYGDGATPSDMSNLASCPAPPHAKATWNTGTNDWDPYQETPDTVTKLQIKRHGETISLSASQVTALTALGLTIGGLSFTTSNNVWQAIKAYIEADADREEEWNIAASDIPSDDPLIIAAATALSLDRVAFVIAAAAL